MTCIYPMITCSILGAIMGMLGCVLVLRKQSLLAEVMSHACYPGMVAGAIIATYIGAPYDSIALCGAIVACVLALIGLNTCTHIHQDSRQAIFLSGSMALGLLFISVTQSIFPTLGRRLHILCIGQAATIFDQYLYAAGGLLCATIVWFTLFHRSLVCLFDEDFGRLYRFTRPLITWSFTVLVISTSALAMRSVGTLLLVALFIFPVSTAKLLSTKMTQLIWLSAAFGAISPICGVYVAHMSTGLPTGPAIVLMQGLMWCIVACCAPRYGCIAAYIQKRRFTRRCHCENIMKSFWKECEQTGSTSIARQRASELIPDCHGYLTHLHQKGLLVLKTHTIEISPEGLCLGRKLVRYHRLWELYLVQYCGMAKDKVHPTAEQIEHLMTQEIEEELVALLKQPAFDPHEQPIPEQPHNLLLKGAP